MTRNELLKKLQKTAEYRWELACETFPGLVRFDCPIVTLNGRFTKTAGTCEVENNRINLGWKFFEKHYNNMMLVILPHEICHQIDYNLHGLPKNNRWHGPTWQTIMVKSGLEPAAYHSMDI